MIRKVASGPGNWIAAEDLWYFKEGLGQCKSAVSLSMLSKAAQLRVAFSEKWREYGPPLECRARRLQDLRIDTNYVNRNFMWKDWFDRSFLQTLQVNRVSLAKQGVTFSRIEAVLCGQEKDEAKRITKLSNFFEKQPCVSSN